VVGQTLRAEWRYPPTPDAPRLARTLVDVVLEHVGAAEVEPEAELLTSEVVTDAVRQAPSQISVRVQVDPDVLRVEVSDDPGVVPEPIDGALERSTSRRLVNAIAARWGSDLDLHRTTTWFELPLH
jgi:anti-sigma regulatory factor (Ser/Thr protein kinase)